MSVDFSPNGYVTQERLTALGLGNLRMIKDDILVLGLKQTFRNLANSVSEDTPLEQPTKGMVLLHGPDADVVPGLICYFPKFNGVCIEIGHLKFYALKPSDIRIREDVSAETAEQLARNSF